MRLFLTKRAEYGIRLLLHLAALPDRERRTARQLAEACEIPAGNVPTIMNLLSRAGILMCSPGRGGGCALAADPADVSMLQIIETLEGKLDIPHCLLDSRRCHDRDPECAVHAAWTVGRTAAIAALQAISLADTLTRDRETATLVGPGVAAPN